MFKKNALVRALLAAGLTTGLVACGGGSGGGSPSNNDPTGGGSPTDNVQPGSETARFVDSAVSGIEYRAGDYYGLTGDNGEFFYNPDDIIEFNIGRLNLGKISGTDIDQKGLVTPVTLAGPDDDGTIKANIARVLQTLDSDGDPENGITILEGTRTEAANINPTDVKAVDLTAQEVKNTIIKLAKAAGNDAYQPAEIKTEGEAVAHLDDTLAFESVVTSCDGLNPAQASDVKGKTFGIIRLGGGDKEIRVMKFNGDSLEEVADDNGPLQEKSGAWSISDLGLKVADEDTPFKLCKADGYLIAEVGNMDEENSLLYGIKSFPTPAIERSYALSTRNGAAEEIVSIDSELKVTFQTGGPTSQAEIVSGGLNAGALKITDVDDSTDYLYLLNAQGNGRGIYLNFGPAPETAIQSVVVAEPIAKANTDTLAGKATIELGEKSGSSNKQLNSLFIQLYSESGDNQTSVEYSYEESFAGNTFDGPFAEQRTWSFDADGTYTISSTGIDFEGPFTGYLFETENTILVGEDGGISSFYKSGIINADDFVGTYNVNIPTENTVNTELTINSDGTCAYGDASSCNWTVNGEKVDIDFGAGETANPQIWNISGTDTYIYLATHSDDESDIELGYVTRKQ